MGYGNPTQLRIGMTGSFFNRNYRLVGRAVLGIVELGQTYYWNEFYLESSGGAAATLVFEETEGGASWRLFTMFDPPEPMTAQEAATKRQGDVVHFEGAALRITRVDQSKIYFVEGKAPEAIVVGKIAHYFNADAGTREIVVSWTGDQVEFYSGVGTTAPLIATAFRLEGLTAWRFMSSNGRSWAASQLLLPVVLVIALIAIPVGCWIDLSRSRRASVVSIVKFTVPPLPVGASGVLNETPYKITARKLFDVAKVGLRRQRYEYELTGPDDQLAWLISDPRPTGPAWLLCRALQPTNALTPQFAGSQMPGQKIKVDESIVPITELFRATLVSLDGPTISSGKAGDVVYGFVGQMKTNQSLIVEWNETNILYREATPVPAKEVASAFGAGQGDAKGKFLDTKPH